MAACIPLPISCTASRCPTTTYSPPRKAPRTCNSGAEGCFPVVMPADLLADIGSSGTGYLPSPVWHHSACSRCTRTSAVNACGCAGFSAMGNAFKTPFGSFACCCWRSALPRACWLANLLFMPEEHILFIQAAPGLDPSFHAFHHSILTNTSDTCFLAFVPHYHLPSSSHHLSPPCLHIGFLPSLLTYPTHLVLGIPFYPHLPPLFLVPAFPLLLVSPPSSILNSPVLVQTSPLPTSLLPVTPS